MGRRGVRALPVAPQRRRGADRGTRPDARRPEPVQPDARLGGAQPRQLEGLRGHGDQPQRPGAAPDAGRGDGRGQGRRARLRPADLHRPQRCLRRRLPALPDGERRQRAGRLHPVNNHEALVIERDNGQGAAAVFKRIYPVDLRDSDEDGYVTKRLLVDLMNVANPDGLSPYGDPFTFPFFTIEDVEILDADTIAVMNDNNFPAFGGRSATEPDQNEYLEITLAEPLDVDQRLLPAS
ncbi:esterase-like activity of phytase family protein [Nocardioides sp. B-3]|uniref:esterase-like activity of phytase family protein n=1 Tax=Nocardioides sp. B-3 TaxID=2895565 RepID=UPI00300E5C4D